MLPHGGAALLVDKLVETRADGATCSARVPAGSPFRVAREGREVVPSILGLEMGAQAAAAMEAELRVADGEDGEDGAARVGFVVGVRDAQFSVSEVAADSAFEVRVDRAGSAPPLFNFGVELFADGELFARATLSLFVEPR